MKKTGFQPIESVSRLFEMSLIWLHQLRIAGQVQTKCVKQNILYCADDVGKWTNEHSEAYDNRKAMGCFDRVSKSSVNESSLN